MLKIFLSMLLALPTVLGPLAAWADDPAPQSETIAPQSGTIAPHAGFVGGMAATVYNFTAAPRAPELMAKHFGQSDVAEVVASRSRPRQGADVNRWFDFDRDLKKYYGDDKSVRAYSQAQKDLYEALVNRENKLINTVSRAKGNAGETMMHNWYQNNGWERLNSQIGPHGIDGLYVKRSPNGQIVDFMVAESKTGFSALGQTNSGRQMSRNWSLQKILALRGKVDQELQTALGKGDRATVSRCLSELTDLDRIENLHRQGRGRETLHKITLANESGRPVLRMEFYKLKYVSDTEVIPVQRLTKNGTPSRLEVPLDARDPSKLTKTQRAALNGYFGGLEKELTNQGVPAKMAKAAVNRFKGDLARGQVRLTATAQNYETAAMRSILDHLRKNSDLDPNVTAALGKVEKNALRGLPHAFSYRQAAAVGALAGGLMAMGAEFMETGRIGWGSGGAALIGGAVSVGNAAVERYLAIGIDRLSKTNTFQKIGSTGIAKGLRFGRFAKAGGFITMVATTVAYGGYQYASGNITGEQFFVASAEGVAVAVAASVAGAKVGAMVGTAVLPGVGSAVGVAVGAAVGTAYYLTKDVIVARIQRQHNIEMQLANAKLRDRQARENDERNIIRLLNSVTSKKAYAKDCLDKFFIALKSY